MKWLQSATDDGDSEPAAVKRDPRHEPTEACAGVHCYIHGRDETSRRPYLGCVECGHLFRTRLALWWSSVRVAFGFRRFESWGSWLVTLARWVASPPSRIRGCPECGSDL